MKLSLNWLSDYIDIHCSDKELADTLTRAGIEVESMESSAKIPHGVITAKILERNPHPNSDHLSICKVDPGTGEAVQIVCGAPNCDAGKIVPLATLGTVFDDNGKPFEIKPAKLRGVESFGMMCSEKELGISDNHGGLMILPDDTPLGKPMEELYPGDTVFDLELTQNRPDWLSHWGVARDVYALCGGTLKFPPVKLPEILPEEDFSGLVTVNAPDLCPKYTARVIKGVKVGPSPDWMVKHLEAVGIRSINNIVDITNYVMMELGLPLHVFDRALLEGGKIVVRRANAGEKITALDGREYELNPEMLVIADTVKPVAIAGVMGGEYSGVRENTCDVILEAAYFDKTSIRTTSAKLGLSSDASHRYERGADIGMVEKASARAAKLILELAGGKLVSPLVSVAVPPVARPKILCRYAWIRGLLGMEVSDLEMATIFSKLGMEVEPLNDDSCYVTPPTYRMDDVKNQADLAEEVARIYGLDKLPDVPVRSIRASGIGEDKYLPLLTIRRALCSAGLYECYCGSMIDEKTALTDTRFTAEDLVKPVNPISLDLAVMRPSLLGGLLNVVRYNVSRHEADLKLFELGHVFCANPQKYPEEREEIAIAITGRRHPERYSAERNELYDFFDIKGAVETLLENLGKNRTLQFKVGEDSRFVKGECAEVFLNGKSAGFIGKAAPTLTKGMRLAAPLYIGTLEANAVLTAAEKPEHYSPLSAFPSTSRDVAFLAPLDMENGKVIQFIKNARVPDLVDVQLFDIFTNDTIGKDKKSMAYSLTFRSFEKTLTDDDVNKAFEKLKVKLERGLGVELR